MTARDSKGKFTKATRFKVGDRVECLHHGVVSKGTIGTVVRVQDTDLFVDWDGRGDSGSWDHDFAAEYLSKIEDAPAAPEVIATRYRDELLRTQAELREVTVRFDDLKGTLAEARGVIDQQAETIHFMEGQIASAESKLADIATLLRAMEILGPLGGDVTYPQAISAVLGRAIK